MFKPHGASLNHLNHVHRMFSKTATFITLFHFYDLKYDEFTLNYSLFYVPGSITCRWVEDEGHKSIN